MFARHYFRRRLAGLEWAAFLFILFLFPVLTFCWDWTDDVEEAEVIEEIVEDVVPDSVENDIIMIYKFVIVSDESDNFKLQIAIDSTATFMQLRNIILDSAGYTS